ncbi:MAG: SRPBCC family protein [Lachnospiraceae bacterium]|nr:SRPBCC family protein [Lachnospiraceae bacterium]
MTVSNRKVTFPCNIQKVWEVVTSLQDYSWRSDLSKIEVINENQFVEYTKKGYATTFTVTVREPYKRWEFDMENDNMKGHWTGVFLSGDGQTEMELTEEVTAKKILMKPFVKAYLKKQQALYISDLKKALHLQVE